MTTNRSLEKRLESFDLFDSFEHFDPKHNFAVLALYERDYYAEKCIKLNLDLGELDAKY